MRLLTLRVLAGAGLVLLGGVLDAVISGSWDSWHQAYQSGYRNGFRSAREVAAKLVLARASRLPSGLFYLDGLASDIRKETPR